MFGSYAQDKQKAGSDVDLMVHVLDTITDLSERQRISSQFNAVKEFLENQLKSSGCQKSRLTILIQLREDGILKCGETAFLFWDQLLWFIGLNYVGGFRWTFVRPLELIRQDEAMATNGENLQFTDLHDIANRY